MTFALLALAISAQTLDVFDLKWDVEDRADWKVITAPMPTMTLFRPGVPGVPRRPTRYALLQTPMLKRAVIEVEMLREGKSLIIVYAWQDKDHYNYAHLSADDANTVHVHNGIFHVYGGERVRISSRIGPPAFADTPRWTPVKLVFDGKTGRVQVFVNGKKNPSLQAIDMSLTYGRIGLGSFNETGSFRRLNIKAQPVDEEKK